MKKKIYTINEIKEKVIPVLEKSPVVKAILFGSYAHGTATSQSDIDLFIDSNGVLRGFAFYGVLESLVEATEKEIDLIEKQEIIAGALIEQEIYDSGVIIYEK